MINSHFAYLIHVLLRELYFKDHFCPGLHLRYNLPVPTQANLQDVRYNKTIVAWLDGRHDVIWTSRNQYWFSLVDITHRRRKRGGGPGPPIILEGGQHTLWPPQ